MKWMPRIAAFVMGLLGVLVSLGLALATRRRRR